MTHTNCMLFNGYKFHMLNHSKSMYRHLGNGVSL